MKLNNIYLKCSKIFDYLVRRYNFYMTNDKDDVLYIIHSLKDDFYSLDKNYNIYDIKFLQDSINELKIYFNVTANNKIILKSQIMDRMKELLIELESIIKFFESIGFGQGEQDKMLGLEIKLPSSNSLTDLKKYISDLEFIFTKCPFFNNNDEELKFQNIDIGSIWLDFAVVGVALGTGSILLNNIAAFVDRCFIIRSHQLNTLQQKNAIEKAKLETNVKKELLESIDKLYKFLVDNAINELEEISGYKLQDGEERGMAAQSFEKLQVLIDKGLQIYSTIDAPEETKALFEPLEIKYLNIENELKMLEKKTDRKKDN